MGKRREGRQLVVQFLYQHDLNGGEDIRQELEEFWELTEAEGEVREYAEDLIQGVLENKEVLDGYIRTYAENWNFERMAVVDRNILRLALYEMHYREDVPPIASMNEAIELAKALSTEDSGKFVNGILDRAKGDVKRSLR